MQMTQPIVSEYGKRIRIAITLCGLKIPAFGRKYKMALSYLYALEKGVRLLNQDFAERIADAVRQEGYFCTAQWLLNGEGLTPCKETLLQQQTQADESTPLSELTAFLSPELKIIKECALFQTLHPTSLIVGIFDEGMEPFYSKGDYVGGLLKTGPTLNEALNKNCIVLLANDLRIVRQLKQGSSPDNYHLVCTNPATTLPEPILFNQVIQGAAPILWHRRKAY